MGKQSALSNLKIVSLLLRIGLASVFLYAAVSALRQPDAWVSFVPAFTTRFVAATSSLLAISIAQIALAAWLLSGKLVRYAALVSAALLGGIIIFNLGTLLITFRDIGLVFAALALAALDQ